MSELLLSTSENQSRMCQNLRDLPLGRAAWNRVLRQSETRSVFLTWQWLSTWWECYGGDAELYAVAVMRGDNLIGIAPLMRSHQNGARVIEFLGGDLSDYCDVLAQEEDKPAVLSTVLAMLLRRRDRWDHIRLRHIPEHSSTSRILEQLALPDDFELTIEIEATCPALSIDRSRQFAHACTQKKSLLRHTRYFERLSPLDFRYLLDADEIKDHLPEFFEQHRDRRFMAGDRSLFDDTRNRRFFERVSMPMLESNILRFSVLRWRDETLAYHLGFMYDGVYTWYLPSFNVDYARYSAGEVMLRKLLQDALKTRVREFDFTIGESAHKERFTNLKRHNMCIEIASRERTSRSTSSSHSAALSATRRSAIWKPLSRLGRAVGAPTQAAPTQHGSDAPSPRPRLGIRRRLLWRTEALDALPSEFRVRWARYSHIKALTRQEGLRSQALIAALARMRDGQRAVVALWQERPIAVLWLARNAHFELAARGFDVCLPRGAALLLDAHLVSDIEGSPRRAALMPAIQTFLSAEGITALYGVSEAADGPTLPERCDRTLVPVTLRTDVGLVFWCVSFQRKLRGFDDSIETP